MTKQRKNALLSVFYPVRFTDHNDPADRDTAKFSFPFNEDLHPFKRTLLPLTIPRTKSGTAKRPTSALSPISYEMMKRGRRTDPASRMLTTLAGNRDARHSAPLCSTASGDVAKPAPRPLSDGSAATFPRRGKAPIHRKRSPFPRSSRRGKALAPIPSPPTMVRSRCNSETSEPLIPTKKARRSVPFSHY